MGKRQDHNRRLPVVGITEKWDGQLDSTMLPDNPEGAFYAEPEYENHVLPIAELQVDPTYQRPISKQLLNRIVREYDPLLMEPIAVNMRPDSSLWVVDGQHRVAALREKFGPNTLVDCQVYFGLSLAEEARLFNMSDARKPQTPRERFKAGLVSQREPYVSIANVVRKAGWHIADGQPKEIEAVGSIMQIWRQWGLRAIEDVLGIYADAFGYDTPPKAPTLMGLAAFTVWYRGELDRGHLVRTLQKKGLDWLLAEVYRVTQRARMSGRDATIATLINAYNGRMAVERRLLDLGAAELRHKDRMREITARNLIPGRGLPWQRGESVSPETVSA